MLYDTWAELGHSHFGMGKRNVSIMWADDTSALPFTLHTHKHSTCNTDRLEYLVKGGE